MSCMRRVALLLLLSACLLTTFTVAADESRAATSILTLSDLPFELTSTSGPGTVAPSNINSNNSADSTSSSGSIAAFVPIDNRVVTPAPSPPPRASVDSSMFRLVPSPECNETAANLVMRVYAKNRALFSECVSKGKYQIFPFTGELPTTTQITTQALVPACTAIFMGVLLSGLPECTISSMALKSVVETLLKITVDIRAGVPCPDSQQFLDLIIWRRDSNMAQSVGLPYDSTSTLYHEYRTNLWKALTTFNVRMAPDLTISYEGSERSSRVSSSSSSRAGTIAAASSVDETNANSVRNATATTATSSSDSVRFGSQRGSWWLVLLSAAAANALLTA